MILTLFAGSANEPLAISVSERLGLPLGRRTFNRFPDGELHVEIHDSVRGHDVYLIQPTSPSADKHLLDLFLLADACRRAGGARLTAVIPYFGYARQDRRASGREPVGARLIADLVAAAGIERVVAVHLHVVSLEGFFTIPLEHLDAVPVLAQAAASQLAAPKTVIVAPDLGAVKLAEQYAKLLHMPIAIVNKTRISGEEVEARGLVGDVRGRSLLVVDDMISTGGTIEAAIKAALAAGCARDATVISTHGLFVGSAIERLRALPIKRLLVTDSVAPPADLPLPVEVTTLAPLLAEAIKRLHDNRSLSDLIMRG
jgi:ribose-phosphate pyrophosphokinase